uniref:ORF1 n=1 Tax=uncultured densovirus TaxID=748192 RepID=A0A7L7YTV1_9VIRU|nr:ORF1 [uncultured densovirus]
MSFVASADGRWLWNGHRWKAVNLNQEQIDFYNDHNTEIYEGLHEDPVGDPEAIELDEIELNSAEDAPLLEETSFSATPGLAEAGGIAGTSGAGTLAPGAGTIAAGVGVAAGTVIAGTVAGVLSSSDDSDHTDPVVSFPGHHYIGPGNTITDTDPVDTDDIIAREHDIAYNNANSGSDIQEADHNSANEFLTDAIHNNNPHSVAGYIGLKTKEQIEKHTGVLYGLSPTGKQWVDIVGDGILIIGQISVLIGTL